MKLGVGNKKETSKTNIKMYKINSHIYERKCEMYGNLPGKILGLGKPERLSISISNRRRRKFLDWGPQNAQIGP